MPPGTRPGLEAASEVRGENRILRGAPEKIMRTKAILALILASLIISYSHVGAQSAPGVKPSSEATLERTYAREAGPVKMDRTAAFARIHPEAVAQSAREGKSIPRPS